MAYSIYNLIIQNIHTNYEDYEINVITKTRSKAYYEFKSYPLWGKKKSHEEIHM